MAKQAAYSVTRLTITIKEASDTYGLGRETLRRMCEQGELPGRKVGNQWYLDASKLRKIFLGGSNEI